MNFRFMLVVFPISLYIISYCTKWLRKAIDDLESSQTHTGTEVKNGSTTTEIQGENFIKILKFLNSFKLIRVLNEESLKTEMILTLLFSFKKIFLQNVHALGYNFKMDIFRIYVPVWNIRESLIMIRNYSVAASSTTLFHQWTLIDSLRGQRQKGVVLCHPKNGGQPSSFNRTPFLVMGMHFSTQT